MTRTPENPDVLRWACERADTSQVRTANPRWTGDEIQAPLKRSGAAA